MNKRYIKNTKRNRKKYGIRIDEMDSEAERSGNMRNPVVFIYLLIIWILSAIKGLFIEALESFQIDMVLLDTMISKKKFKLSIILSFFGTIPLLMVSVFVAKCSLARTGNVAFETAVIVCGIMWIKAFLRFLFKKKTSQFMELTECRISSLCFWLFKGVECVLSFCLWQELGLGALVVYLFGSIIRSNAFWFKHEMDTFETDIRDMVQTFGGEMKLGSTVMMIGTVLCTVRLVNEGNSTLGLLCAAAYCVLQIVLAYSMVFDKGYFKLFSSEKYQEKIPVSENGARLIQKRRKETVRTISIKDVAMEILPLAIAVAAWGFFSAFSMGLLSAETLPWNVLILVCVLIHSFLSGGYYGSFHRLASFLVLIPAFILLWSTVGNISILGVLVLQFGKLLFQWDKYQLYL